MSAAEEEVVRVRAYRDGADAPSTLRCKFYVRDDVLALSATVPILENLGLFVESEINFELHLAAAAGREARVIHVHELEARAADGAAIDLDGAGRQFEAAFAAIWTGKAENDGFNRLILKLAIPWREAALMRALARYRQQSGLDPSQAVQEEALAAYPEITSLLLALFRVRFDPNLPEDLEARADWGAQIGEKIEAALNGVPSLDHDRALRRLAALINAIVRTSYYQAGASKTHMSFKIASGELVDLPAPKPYREIWVASPQVEGVHLRMGPVARGGLRWSDRRDDFRTEVLDLVKAQQVKNAIIVPVGAKGGFFPKRLPPRGAAGYREEGEAAYRVFLRGLLDITDTIEGEAVRAPADVVRWDGDDPYLVVAADKGTATFSDIANSISAEYGFWLGDAFASGGSAGYDHKVMGITAKGAWEAVKRHFREMGKNIQEEPFSVIGVGDMSGDVFGNGMLLSKQIRLVAAFDHRDIFIDPNPDAAKSWAERKRLFDLPRSSWADYDKTLISAGGGVFSRALKAIPITAEIAALTGLAAPHAAPSELISALLKAECELLWFGGIGAYVKARAESNADVGDKANDGLRVNAEDLRADVIGEGANLGVTQLGRIAFARKGGRINTDAVDNSAGVDTSDHEVNIKILLADVIRSGALAVGDRDALLASMTDEVGRLVLSDNYDQTLALSIAEAAAPADLDSHERFMQRLESAGKLSRAVEQLPRASQIAELRAMHQGLTRPELAKLIAYAKIDLFDALTASAAPDDPAFADDLEAYFPPELSRFAEQRRRHRLRREIIATQLADDIVNRCGPSFVDRVCEAARVGPVAVACAFEAGRRIFDARALSARVNALDNEVSAAAQVAMHREIGMAMRRFATYLARHAGFLPEAGGAGIEAVVAAYERPVAEVRGKLWDYLTDAARNEVATREAMLAELGAPRALAREAAQLRAQGAALDIADLARKSGWPVAAAALVYREIGAQFGLDALRAAAFALKLDQHWDRLAVRRASEDLFEDQRVLAEGAGAAIGAPPDAPSADWAAGAVREWVERLGAPALRAREAFDELASHGPWTFAKVMIVTGEVNALANAQR
jgi:glutamate dehydrogenase